VKKKRPTMSTMTRIQRLALYNNNSSETDVIRLTDGFVGYCDNVKYIGSHVSFDLYKDFELRD